MAKNKHFDHASHNNNVCDYLDQNNEYADWTIISAFYAALHFVSHKIFPIRCKTAYTVETIEEYINIYLNDRSVSKHYALVKLVYSNCDRSIGSKYRKLLDLSKTARYADYNIDRSLSDSARKCLYEIKEFCSK